MAKNHPFRPFRIRINCARPSFLEGMARVLDLGGTLNEYNLNEYDLPFPSEQYLDDLRAGRIPANLTQPENDTAAMRQDWIAVGQYIRSAMNEIDAVTPAVAKKRTTR